MAQQRIGGSFAPPIDKATLAGYRKAAETADPDVKDIITSLADMVELFQKTPASKRNGTPHPSGRGVVVPLEDAEVERIWDAVPWDYELDAMQARCDRLPADSPLRTPAFHLLWYARELTLDREPLTADKL